MPTDPLNAPSERRAWRLVETGCEVAAVLAWLLLVLRDQYGARSLQAFNQVSFDELFLASIAGAAVARALGRK